jgi:hypothetical protein
MMYGPEKSDPVIVATKQANRPSAPLQFTRRHLMARDIIRHRGHHSSVLHPG